jgi:hypothetical protein
VQIKKLKDEKKTQPKLNQHVNKESMIDKETMTNLVEIEKSLDVKI